MSLPFLTFLTKEEAELVEAEKDSCLQAKQEEEKRMTNAQKNLSEKSQPSLEVLLVF